MLTQKFSLVQKVCLLVLSIISLHSFNRLPKLHAQVKTASWLLLFRNPALRLVARQAKRHSKQSSILLDVWSLFGSQLLQTKDLKLYAVDCFWTARTKQPAMLFVMHSAKCIRTILKIFRLNPRKWNIVTALYLATRYIQKYSIVSMAIGQHWRDSSAQEVCCV